MTGNMGGILQGGFPMPGSFAGAGVGAGAVGEIMIGMKETAGWCY